MTSAQHIQEFESYATSTDQPEQTSTIPFRLEPHSTARNAAIATIDIPYGTSILTSTPLATILIDSERGKRCDFCLYPREELQRCTGCKIFWYCDRTCQTKAWKAHHRRLCPRMQKFMASPSPQASPDSKLHLLLLAQLMTEHGTILEGAFDRISMDPRELPWKDALPHPITALLTLLPAEGHTDSVMSDLSVFGLKGGPIAKHLTCRFANNNFAMHSSRMDVFGHGIFPLASRAFNHSCYPNAVPIYRVTSNRAGAEMNVVTLRNISKWEEITIPYVDPALPYDIRRRQLKEAYGFACQCPACQSPLSQISQPIEFDIDSKKSTELELLLRGSVLPVVFEDTPESSRTLSDFRMEIIPKLSPNYLPSLSEEFSEASHSGSYDKAIEKGKSLLALYFLLYPANYPMIGLHALELAKICWNAFVTNPSSLERLVEMNSLLDLVEKIFITIFGGSVVSSSEDDPIIIELRTLKSALNSEVVNQ
ncbi:hypothetical protein M422DRAFT_775528 [Sphaerobolus stellatus SS14]|nr:hypothetical protein M422DRAFT_775528 [Sphaerobolus stellatus SS14]